MALSRSQNSFVFSHRWFENSSDPSIIWNQHFGNVLLDSDLHMPMHYGGYLIRHRTRATFVSSGTSEVTNDNRKFKVMLDVKHFKHEEVEVKVVNNYVIIHGKHEKKPDEHGFIQREFTRRYLLPNGIDAFKIKSTLNAKGVLTAEAEKVEIVALSLNECVVPISMVTE